MMWGPNKNEWMLRNEEAIKSKWMTIEKNEVVTKSNWMTVEKNEEATKSKRMNVKKWSGDQIKLNEC